MYDAIGKSNEEMGEGFWTVEDMKNNNHSAYRYVKTFFIYL